MPRPTLTSLRAGVIGTGFIGPVHIEALQRIGVRVTAVCGSARSAAPVAERWGIPEIHGGHDHQALIRSPAVDVVHIASPNRCHHVQALAVLRAGKHCVCEKPLAMNARETAAIVKAARRSGTVFAVCYNVRFYPAVAALRRLVARGDLGEVIHVHGSYFQDWLLKDTDYNWRLLPAEGGALRAVADIGTHWLDAVCFILGAGITRVLARLGTFHHRRRRPRGEIATFAKAAAKMRYASYPVRTEDFASILLEFAGGAHGNLAVSQVAAGRKNAIRIEVYGSRGSAAWSAEEPETIWLGSRDGPNAVAVRGSGLADGIWPRGDYPPGHVEGFPDTFKMLFRNVYQDIATGGKADKLYATAADGDREVRVCEAILRSHRAGCWTKIREG
jgi:predicted dehydrogenase